MQKRHVDHRSTMVCQNSIRFFMTPFPPRIYSRHQKGYEENNTLFFFDIALGVYASTAFQYSPSNCELLWSYFSVMASLKGKQRWRPNLSTKNLPKFLRLNIKTHPQEESPVCTGSKITKRFFCRKYEKMFLFAYFTWITKTNDDIMTGSVATEHASISFSELNINGHQARCQ